MHRTIQLAAGAVLALGLARPGIAQRGKPDSLEIAARPILAAFKRSVLELGDGRKSSVTIESALHWQQWTNQFTLRAWAAEEYAPGQWVVSVTGRIGKSDVTAQWSFNAATGSVSARDALAAELGYRHIPTLTCVLEAEARAAAQSDTGARKPVTVKTLVILPVPVPPRALPYRMEARFAVDADGKAEIMGFTPSGVSEYDKKVVKSLLGYVFRPALDYYGVPECGRSMVRVTHGSR